MTPSDPTGNQPSRVSLATVFTVGFGLVLVVALVFFLLRTKVSLTLTLGSALAAVAMDHAVAALVRRGLHRSWAIGTVIAVVTALLVGVGLLLVPPSWPRCGRLPTRLQPSGRGCRTRAGSGASTTCWTCRSACASPARLRSGR